MQKRVLKIGITTGDPAGIGPEVALKAINSIDDNYIIPVLIGRESVLKALYSEEFQSYEIINHPQRNIYLKKDKKYLYNLPSDIPLSIPGQGSIDTGIESLEYINMAVSLWQSGFIDAIVTGPVSKGFIEKSGVPFTGHTEYIADLLNEREPYMMMFSRDYRVLLATTHIPVSKIIDIVDEERLVNVIKAGYNSVKSIDGGDIRMAISGLDPHCGDDGAIGDFDREVTQRAVLRAQREGINIEGPFAADTLFIPDKWEKYNLVIAQYHDQGLIPFKILAFDSGVNVTVGLSVTRTSVDHGTAFDIAGEGNARYKSMIEAIKLAFLLESNKNQ